MTARDRLPKRPVLGLLNFAVGGDGENSGRTDLPDSGIDGVRRRHVVVPQKQRERSLVDVRSPIRVYTERLEFRSKDEGPPHPRVIQRFLTEAVPRQVQRSRLPIPQHKREHARASLERRP